MNKRIFLIVGVIVLVAAASGGAFYGGMQYQQARTASLRNAFFAGRGGNGGANAGGNGQGFGGGQGGNRGGAFGQIKSIDGDTLTISTAQNVTTVHLTSTTVLNKMVAAQRADLQVGETVTVRGTADSSGAITATAVQVQTQQQPAQAASGGSTTP